MHSIGNLLATLIALFAASDSNFLSDRCAGVRL